MCIMFILKIVFIPSMSLKGTYMKRDEDKGGRKEGRDGIRFYLVIYLFLFNEVNCDQNLIKKDYKFKIKKLPK